jgi:hypothetical protein
MDTKANAFDAGRASGCHRIRSSSIHSRRAPSAIREARTLRPALDTLRPHNPGVSHVDRDRLPLSTEDLFKFFPGSLASDLSIGRRILEMANSIFVNSKSASQDRIWQEFLADTELHEEHHITQDEIEMLKTLAPLGMLTGSGDILFILNKIRWARLRHK